MSNWYSSVFSYDKTFTEKFDELAQIALKEILRLEEDEDWDFNDKERYNLMKEVIDMHEKCRTEMMKDI